MKRGNVLIILFILILAFAIFYFLREKRAIVISPSAPTTTQPTFPYLWRSGVPSEFRAKVDLPPETVEKIQNSEPGLTYWAQVKGISGNNLSSDVLWYDPLRSSAETKQVIIKINPELAASFIQQFNSFIKPNIFGNAVSRLGVVLAQSSSNGSNSFPNCTLSASPISGPAPLTVRFSIDIRNGTFAGWNGPCNLSNGSCSYTYNERGTYGPYTAYVSGVAGRSSCDSPAICVCQMPFDLSISDLKVNTTICRDTQRVSNINEYGVRYPDNRFPPVAGTQATSTPEANCPETQINRPIDVSFKVNCSELEPGGCEMVCPYTIQVNFYGDYPNSNATFTPRSDPITFNGPRYITQEINWQRNRAYYQTDILNYIPTTTINLYSHYFQRPAGTTTVQVCLLNDSGVIYTDADNLNNCVEKTIEVYNYYCFFGFCSQGVYDPQRDPLYKDQFPYRHDNHCRYWRNNICRAMIR